MTLIARRLKAAREAAGLTQQQLSDQLGFKDRQTVAAIEAGQRKVSAEELIKIMRILDKDLEYFTDPYRLDGEGKFSWRSAAGMEKELAVFEQRAGGWLAMYRTLAFGEPEPLKTLSRRRTPKKPAADRPGAEEPDTRGVREVPALQAENWWDALRTRPAPMSLALTTKSTYEEAHHAAEWLANEWKLGDVPALTLEAAIRERMRTLVLYADAPYGISGAAFRLPEVTAIIINRGENPGRRSFDLAHELFHLLTWETLRPAHTELGMLNPKSRHEQLANCFASSLLMPERVVRTWMGDSPKVSPRLPVSHQESWRAWLNDRAYQMRVSTPALQWRLVQLDLLDKSNVDSNIDWVGQRDVPEGTPRLFGEEFVNVLHAGLGAGQVSVRRAAALLGMSIDDLAALFGQYQLDVPFDI